MGGAGPGQAGGPCAALPSPFTRLPNLLSRFERFRLAAPPTICDFPARAAGSRGRSRSTSSASSRRTTSPHMPPESADVGARADLRTPGVLAAQHSWLHSALSGRRPAPAACRAECTPPRQRRQIRVAPHRHRPPPRSFAPPLQLIGQLASPPPPLAVLLCCSPTSAFSNFDHDALDCCRSHSRARLFGRRAEHHHGGAVPFASRQSGQARRVIASAPHQLQLRLG